MAAFNGWATGVLRGIGAPVTAENVRALNAWQRAEGGAARFNPLNTTQHAPGAGTYNSVGVKNFVSPRQGVQATVQTLLNGHYGNIVGLLRSGRAPAVQIADAVGASPWGTSGSTIRSVLGAGPVRGLAGVRRGGSYAAGAVAPGALAASRGQQQRGVNPALLAVINQGNEMFGLPTLPDIPQVQVPRRIAAPVAPRPQGGARNPVGVGTYQGSPGGSSIRWIEHLAAPFGLQVTSTTGGKHAPGSYHYKGRAVDMAGNPGRMAALARFALQHANTITEMFYTGPGNPGYFIKNGRVYPNSQLDPGLAQEHTNHVHIAK